MNEDSKQENNTNNNIIESIKSGSLFKRKLFWIITVILIVIIAISINNIGKSEKFSKDSKSEQKLLTVQAVKAKRGSVQQWLIGDGTTRAVKREFLKFEYPGKVVMIGTDSNGSELKDGSSVKSGQLLAQIDRREYSEDITVQDASLDRAKESINSAKAVLTEATKTYDLAKLSFERSNRLFEKDAISALELETAQAKLFNAEAGYQTALSRLEVAKAEVKATQAQLKQAMIKLEKTNIYAPFTGIISYLNIKKGDFFSPEAINASSEESMLKSTPIVVIDPSKYEITLNLPSYEGKLVKIGQIAYITWGDFTLPGSIDELESLEDFPFAVGQVYSINPAISPTGRTIQVKIRTTERANFLKDGLFVTCWLVVKEKDNAVLAPASALITRNNADYIFVVDKKTGKVTKHKVTLGVEGMKEVEILKGIKPGDMLVTEGRHRLIDGAEVKLLTGNNGE